MWIANVLQTIPIFPYACNVSKPEVSSTNIELTTFPRDCHDQEIADSKNKKKNVIDGIGDLTNIILRYKNQ